VLGTSRYRAANGRLRDAGRALSGTRDAAVLLETLDALVAASGLDPRALHGLRERLAGEYAAAHGRALEDAGPRAEALEHIVAVRADAARWSLGPRADEAVLRGRQRVYGRGRGRLREARRAPTPEALHEWRKRAKDLGYSLRLVAPAWPAALEPLAGETQRLWELLGADHDLHLLAEAAAERADDVGSPAALAGLGDAVAARHRANQGEAFRLGRRLYHDRARDFAHRVGGYLRTWQHDDVEVRADGAAAPQAVPAAHRDP
jgi:CHAD domain-containing protein